MPLTTFADALEAHLGALQRRDIDAFSDTVGHVVTVVDGKGTITNGRLAVLQAHRDWFASREGWEFSYDVVTQRDFGTSAYGLIDVRYRDRPGADASNFLLLLIFERESDGTWKFVYDQNTPIR